MSSKPYILTRRELVVRQHGSSPFAQCHAPSVAMNGDRVAVAFFAGTKERHPDTAIWGSQRAGKEWSAPKVIVKLSEVAHWNPVLFNEGGRLWLFFKVGENIDQWETWRCQLGSDLKPLMSPRKLVPHDGGGGRGPVRSRPIVLSNGDWVAPASTEKTYGNKIVSPGLGWIRYKVPLAAWDCFVDRSLNCGKSWHKSKPVPFDREKYGQEGGIIQPTLWESFPGHVHMLIRSSHGYLFRSDSTDFGKTWTQAYKTGIPNPNSAVDVAMLDDGQLVMGMNPVSGNWTRRNPISIMFSDDPLGTMWDTPITVEEDDEGSFSYPSILSRPNGFLMAYSWNRLDIAFVEASRKEEGDASNPVNP